MNELPTVLDQLNSSDEPTAYKGRLALTKIVADAGAPGQEAGRDEVARLLAEALGNGGKYSVSARQEIARRLGEIGGDREVPALESALVDLDVREAARFGLDRIPTKSATDALVKASKSLIGARFLAGIANALGQRTGDGVVDALTQLTADPSVEVRLAAAEGLAQQADESADAKIVSVMEQTDLALTAQEVGRLWKARVRLAGQLSAANKKAEAKRILEAIVAAKPPAPQLKAAQMSLESMGMA
jgi:HEAT repeat protein